MPERNFDCIFFDLGNTLIHFSGDWSATAVRAHKKLAAALIAMGAEIDEAAFANEFSKRLQAYNQARKADMREPGTITILDGCLRKFKVTGMTRQQKQNLLKIYYSISEAQWILPYETHFILNKLRVEGYRMGLISNAADSANVYRQIGKARLAQFMEQALISNDLDIRKPDPRIFYKMLSAMNAVPDRTVMVGDTLNADILGARNSGIRSVWVTRWANTPENAFLRKVIRPDATIYSLLQLPRVLKRLKM